MIELYEKLKQYGEVLCDVSLKKCTTLKIGGIAKFVVYPKSILALTCMVEEINEFELPYKVMGKGSNILCSDKNYEGVIIKLDKTLTEAYFDGNICYAEAGCSIIKLAHDCCKKGLSGLEFASGIPATVGGTTFMNAGAYKSNMANIISEVFVLIDNQAQWISDAQCQFSYRHSIFHDNPDWIILAVRLVLTHDDKDVINDLMLSRKERRMSTQPLDYPSAGSVFRNPVSNGAWHYIEEIGYRDKMVGGAKVSPKHVNFIINYNNASAKDFMELVKDIQNKVKMKFDVELVMEVELFNW